MKKCDQCLYGENCKHRFQLLRDVERTVDENISILIIPKRCRAKMLDVMSDAVLEQCGIWKR